VLALATDFHKVRDGGIKGLTAIPDFENLRARDSFGQKATSDHAGASA
jgi:hypothetical protein